MKKSKRVRAEDTRWSEMLNKKSRWGKADKKKQMSQNRAEAIIERSRSESRKQKPYWKGAEEREKKAEDGAKC